MSINFHWWRSGSDGQGFPVIEDDVDEEELSKCDQEDRQRDRVRQVIRKTDNVRNQHHRDLIPQVAFNLALLKSHYVKLPLILQQR